MTIGTGDYVPGTEEGLYIARETFEGCRTAVVYVFVVVHSLIMCVMCYLFCCVLFVCLFASLFLVSRGEGG